MNHLIAKTRGKNGEFLKILSNKNIFTTPDFIGSPKTYEPSYKLDEDECFKIDKLSKQEYCPDFLKNKFVSTEYNQINVGDYFNIDYLCSIQAEKYHFQKMRTNQILRKKWFQISDNPVLVENEPIIIINSVSDAIYDSKKDVLFFKSLSAISSIFSGIEVLYREATDKETEDFLGNDFLNLSADYTASSVKPANRKRIALVIDSLNSLSKKEKKNVFSYIKGYCTEVQFKKNAFCINSEADLKLVLYGIDQRYYTTPFSKEKRLANSITKI